MDPKVFHYAQHSLLKRWPVSAHLSGHHQTCIPEPKRETKKKSINYIGDHFRSNFGSSSDLHTRTQQRNWKKKKSIKYKGDHFRPIFRAIIRPIYQKPRKELYKLSINYKGEQIRPNFGPSSDLQTRTQERNCTNYLQNTKMTIFGTFFGPSSDLYTRRHERNCTNYVYYL
jgi:hypothetical protein